MQCTRGYTRDYERAIYGLYMALPKWNMLHRPVPCLSTPICVVTTLSLVCPRTQTGENRPRPSRIALIHSGLPDLPPPKAKGESRPEWDECPT